MTSCYGQCSSGLLEIIARLLRSGLLYWRAARKGREPYVESMNGYSGWARSVYEKGEESKRDMLESTRIRDEKDRERKGKGVLHGGPGGDNNDS